LIHDVLAKLIEASGTGSGQSTFDIGGFDFASSIGRFRAGRGRFKPERFGIQSEQAWLGSKGVTELETKFDRERGR